MCKLKKYLSAKDFQDGLMELDKEMGYNAWLFAFAPIQLIAAGGFLAVSYLKNRDSTGDIDYLIDPALEDDNDVKRAFKGVAQLVGDRLGYNEEWINNEMAVFASKKTRQILFKQAKEQGITLFKGKNLEVLAAPIEWVLERKLRRIYATNRDRKADLDMEDAITLLKHLRTRNQGPLDVEVIRTMNVNEFDVIPDERTMKVVANIYRNKYSEEIFN